MKPIYFFLILALALGGCTKTAAPKTQVAAAVKNNPIPPATVTLTATLTYTLTLSRIPTITLTPTPTPADTPRLAATPTTAPTQPAEAWPAANAQGLHHARSLELEGEAELSTFFFAPDGGLYLVGREASLRALAPDGSLCWQSSSRLKAWMFGLSPDGKQLYMLDSDNVIYALDSQDGKQLWKFAAPQNLADLTITPSGDLYIVIDNKYANIMDFNKPAGAEVQRLSAGGKPLPFTWPQQVDQPDVIWGLLVGPQNELMVYSYHGLIIMDPAGALLHNCTAETEFKINSSTGLEAGQVGDQPAVFYVDKDDVAVARSLDCKELWRLPLGKPAAADAVMASSEQTEHSTALAWSEAGMLYIGRSNGQVLAVDSQGQLAWNKPPDERLGELISLKAGPDGQLYALGGLGYFLSVTPDGQETWAHEFYDPGQPYSLEALPDVAAMMQGNKLHFFNTDPAQSVEDPPAQPPENIDQARLELEQILLDHLVLNAFGVKPGDYQVVDQPLWEQNPEEAALLVQLGPANDPSLGMFKADDTQVLRVWWYAYADGKLYAATDPQQAIKEFEKGYKDGFATPSWTRYNFSLLSVSEDGRQARAYLEWYCGPLCGQGRDLTLKRSLSGEWWMVKDEMTWIS